MNDFTKLNCGTKQIRELISSEFPAVSYHGEVMAARHNLSVYESAEDDLDIVLNGKTWKDISTAYINENDDDYVLMNGPAVVAFLAAWLWRAAEDLEGPNDVRNSLAFHLARLGDPATGVSGLWGRSFFALGQKQYEVIRVLMKCSVEHAANQEKSLIEKALKNLDSNAESRIWRKDT